MPWPFALVVVGDQEITFRSWHFSWWMRDQTATRESIHGINKLHPKAGVTRIIIQRENADGVSVTPNGADGELLARDLQLRGYVIDLSQ